MEFELVPSPLPVCMAGERSPRPRLGGLAPASLALGSRSLPASSAGLDDRHGLIRTARAVLVLLASAQQHIAAVAAPPATRRRARGVGSGGARAAPSPRRPARAASVSVAAGEAAHKAASGALRTRPLQQLLAGGVAGAVSKTLVAPLERVSTMLMADSVGLGDAVAHAWRQGGLAGLFRGNAATLAKIFPASAIQFAVFHSLKDALLAARTAGAGDGGGKPGAVPAQEQQQAAAGELSNAERLLAGAAAGAASVSFTYPLESTRTLMSVAGGLEGSLFSVCRSVVRSGGVRALYRGFQATLVGDVMGTALGFTTYEIFNRMWKDANDGRSAPPSVRGLIGGLSAACTMTLTMPLEVVRRRLQVQGLGGRPVLYRGTLDCMAQIARREGLRGFYRAALPSYLKVAPSIGAMYFLYELLTRHLDAPDADTTASESSGGSSSGPAANAASAPKQAAS